LIPVYVHVIIIKTIKVAIIVTQRNMGTGSYKGIDPGDMKDYY